MYAKAKRWSSAGNTRGLIEATSRRRTTQQERRPSSAGNTRGLIEAASATGASVSASRLPRGIPAASLKHSVTVRPIHSQRESSAGIPAASLKQPARRTGRRIPDASSAGNTRGLIEAPRATGGRTAMTSLPRGIPAASLKRSPDPEPHRRAGARLPRGIPAASLKLRAEPLAKTGDRPGFICRKPQARDGQWAGRSV